MIGIYLIINTLSNDFYLGSSIDIERRWSQHRDDLRSGIHYNLHLQRAWLKYTAEAFEMRVLLECNINELRQTEQVLLDTLHPSYNLNPNATCPPGTLGKKWSEEARQHLSEAMKKRDSDPEFRKVKSKARRDSWTGEERQKKSRESSIQFHDMWNDPEMRSQLLSHRRSPEFRKAKSEWMKELNARRWRK